MRCDSARAVGDDIDLFALERKARRMKAEYQAELLTRGLRWLSRRLERIAAALRAGLSRRPRTRTA